jgi:hypothetical protein
LTTMAAKCALGATGTHRGGRRSGFALERIAICYRSADALQLTYSFR